MLAEGVDETLNYGDTTGIDVYTMGDSHIHVRVSDNSEYSCLSVYL